MAIPYSRTVFAGLPWYSVLIVTGIVLAILIASREERRVGLPKDTAVDIALIVIPCGIVGARMYYVLMSWHLFADDPISALYIWEGGIAIYGAVIGGGIGALCYALRKKLPFGSLTDIMAPGLLLAQAIGRWGNYFNMEAYGPVIADPRLQFFPLGVLIPAASGYVWHMATFFYESAWNLCGFAALWLLRRRQRGQGDVFAWYLLIYGSGRFIIEQLRQDSLYLLGFRASQWLSLALCAVAAVLLLRRALGGRRLAVAAACTALWLSRWFLLEQPLWYAVVIAAAAVCAWRVTRSAWAAAVLAADVMGLAALWVLRPLSAQIAAATHAVLCSATLPAYVAVFYLHTKEEVSLCPSEP